MRKICLTPILVLFCAAIVGCPYILTPPIQPDYTYQFLYNPNGSWRTDTAAFPNPDHPGTAVESPDGAWYAFEPEHLGVGNIQVRSGLDDSLMCDIDLSPLIPGCERLTALAVSSDSTLLVAMYDDPAGSICIVLDVYACDIYGRVTAFFPFHYNYVMWNDDSNTLLRLCVNAITAPSVASIAGVAHPPIPDPDGPCDDDEAPIFDWAAAGLSLDQPLIIQCGSSFTPPVVPVWDDVDGDLTAFADVTHNVNTSQCGSYYVHYHVTDSCENQEQDTINVVVEGDCDGGIDPPDPENPSPRFIWTAASYNGGNVDIDPSEVFLVQCDQGGVWDPPIPQVIDGQDGDLTAQQVITSNVDVTTPGSYEVNYHVTDSDENQEHEVLTVVVQCP